MQKSPELIIEEFESRQEIESTLRQRKLRRRTFEVIYPFLFGVGIAVLAALVLPDRKLLIWPFAVLAVAYLDGDRRQRWALEDRVEALEKKAMTKALS